MPFRCALKSPKILVNIIKGFNYHHKNNATHKQNSRSLSLSLSLQYELYDCFLRFYSMNTILFQVISSKWLIKWIHSTLDMKHNISFLLNSVKWNLIVVPYLLCVCVWVLCGSVDHTLAVCISVDSKFYCSEIDIQVQMSVKCVFWPKTEFIFDVKYGRSS